jgi:hypothetical protein
MMEISAQLGEVGVLALPLSLFLPPPLELLRSLHPVPSKTSEIKLPVLSHVALLPFSLVVTINCTLQYCSWG